MPRLDAEPNPKLWFELTTQVRAEESDCWLCGRAIDKTLPPRTPRSFSVDHVKPKSKYPELRYVRANLRAAHYGCNSRKKDTAPTRIEPRTRTW